MGKASGGVDIAWPLPKVINNVIASVLCEKNSFAKVW
jgi:hypothetical protein